MTRKELEERLFSQCNCTIAGTYTIFQGLKGKLADIAEEYASEKVKEAENAWKIGKNGGKA